MCPPFILKWVGCPYLLVLQMSCWPRYEFWSGLDKVVAAIKVDAAINLVAAIKVVGTKAEGLHVLQLAQ